MENKYILPWCILIFIAGSDIGYSIGYNNGYTTGWYVGEGDGFINAKHFEYVGYEKGIELGTLKTIAYYQDVPFNITDKEREFFEDQQQKLSSVLNESPVDISFPIALGSNYAIYDHVLNISEVRLLYEGGI